MNESKKIFLSLMITVTIFIAGCGGEGGEACYKNYQFAGTVVDNNSLPLADVDVILYGISDVVLTTTISDGSYSWDSQRTRSNYAGRGVKFVKAGYQTVEAERFTVIEAGKDVCGSLTLRRDAVLQPE